MEKLRRILSRDGRTRKDGEKERRVRNKDHMGEINNIFKRGKSPQWFIFISNNSIYMRVLTIICEEYYHFIDNIIIIIKKKMNNRNTFFFWFYFLASNRKNEEDVYIHFSLLRQ